MKKIIALLVFASILAVGCKAKQDVTLISGYYTYDSQCITMNRDGSIMIKTWGEGINQEQAELNARRNAVDDALFKGFRNPCELSPLISNPNTKRDQKDFFDNFYKDNGMFSRFVSKSINRKLKSKEKELLKDGEKAFEVTLRVDINGLRSYIKQNLN